MSESCTGDCGIPEVPLIDRTDVATRKMVRTAESEFRLRQKKEPKRLKFLRLAKTRNPIPSMRHCLVAWRYGASYTHDSNKCLWCDKIAEN